MKAHQGLPAKSTTQLALRRWPKNLPAVYSISSSDSKATATMFGTRPYEINHFDDAPHLAMMFHFYRVVSEPSTCGSGQVVQSESELAPLLGSQNMIRLVAL